MTMNVMKHGEAFVLCSLVNKQINPGLNFLNKLKVKCLRF